MMKNTMQQMLAALAVLFSAVSGYGETLSPGVVFPLPGEAAARGGYWQLPKKIGIAFPAGVKAAADDLGRLCLSRGIALTAETPERALIRLKLRTDGVPEHDEGYVLEIGHGGVEISARAEAGLFYGLQTLRAMLTAAGDAGLPCCRIADRPRFDRRTVAFSLHGAEPNKLDLLKKFLNTAAALKYNRVAIEFADNFPYRDDPFHTSVRRFGESEIRDLVDFSRERFIRIVPMLRIWNDCPMLVAYPRRDDLLEIPYGQNMRYSYCPRNPGIAPLIGKVVAGQTALLHPEGFIFQIDRTGLRQAAGKCAKCRDLPLDQLAIDHLRELGKVCRDAGVKAEFIFSADPARRPCGTDRKTAAPLRAEFDCVAEAPLGHPALMKRNIRRAAEAGKRSFVLSGMSAIRGGSLLPLTNNSVYSLGGLVDGAGYLWSGAGSPRHPDAAAYFFSLFHERPFAVRSGRAVAVPLGGAVNAMLNACADFPAFTVRQLTEIAGELAARPEGFRLTTGRGSSYYGVRLAGERNGDAWPGKAEIALGGVRASAIDLLLSCTKPPQQAEYSPWHGGGRLFAQPTVATVTVSYENGKNWTAPLRYTNSIACWNHPYGGYKLRIAAAAADTAGRSCHFDALHLKNPYPDQPIRSIVLSSSRHDGIAPVLLALSLEDAQGGKLPEGSFEMASYAKLIREPDGRDRIIQWDFEDSSLKKAYVETANMTFAPGAAVRIDYPVDTASPEHNRVLRITVPPATAENPELPLRVTVNFPWSPRGTVKSLLLACRVDRPEDLRGAFQVLVNTPDKSSYTQEFFPSDRWEVFHTALDNRDVLSTKVMRDLRRSNMRKAVFVFKALPKGIEIRLDDIGISRLRRHDLPAFAAE